MSSNRVVPREIPGSEQVRPAQLVLLAMGFLGPGRHHARSTRHRARQSLATCSADYGSYATNLEGVFAAGDMRRGQSLVVWAIHEGRGAARECDRYLMGETGLP